MDVTPPARESASVADWLTSGEAAASLGVSRKTVVRWVNTGLLPARRIRAGGQFRIERAAVERFKAEQQQEVRPKVSEEDRSPPKAS